MIRRAKAMLEAEARDKAQQQQAESDKAGKIQKRKAVAAEPVPEDKAQSNFTDPELRIMRTRGGSFEQCYGGR